jgi:hypothetical protein
MHLLPVSAVFIWGGVPRQLEIKVTYTESYIDSETTSLHLSFKIHKFSYYSVQMNNIKKYTVVGLLYLHFETEETRGSAVGLGTALQVARSRI